MRILAFVDLHANEMVLAELTKRAKEADLVLCAGDMSIFGMQLYDMLEAMNKWGKPVFLIHGNHEDPSLLEDVNEHYENLHFVHGIEKEFDGISVLGWGGGGFSERDPQLAAFAKKLKPKRTRILMFHGPPKGTAADYRPDWEVHVGCLTRRDVVERLEPVVAICGHIHESFGAQSMIGRTLVLNPGPLGKFISIETKEEGNK